MSKNLFIYMYGAIIIFVGFILLFSINYTFETINTGIGFALIIAATLGFLTTFSRKRTKVAFLYHEMHALAMLVYGIAVLLFCNTYEILVTFTSFLFLFYACSEIIFCSWLFNLGRKMNYRIVFLRLFLGLIVGIGVVIILSLNDLELWSQLKVTGFLFTVIGANIMLYVPIMKARKLNETLE